MFDVGRTYNRARDIHDVYGGQQRGGISTPHNGDLIFLFTGAPGKAHGYKDEFRPDGTFWYTGEGQRGDMEFRAGNRAIRHHQEEGKRLLLFEILSSGVRYLGEVHYLGHHTEERPDTDGHTRRAIVFELDLGGDAGVSSPPPILDKAPRYSSMSLSELRALAVAVPPKNAAVAMRRRLVHQRSEAVRAYVLRRANGSCEACGAPAPFRTPNRRDYLEPHHILRLSDGGPDDPKHVAAVCPNCHREAHYGQYSEALNERLRVTIAALEPTLLP